MRTVGSDQRPEYYLVSPAAVIAELGSHRMGLTNAEAGRRRSHQGDNALPFFPVPPRLVSALQQEWEYLALLGVALVLAAYLEQPAAVIIFSTLFLARLAIRFDAARSPQARLNSLGAILPTSASVLRNNNLHTTETRRLVVGDIVHIKTGDVVPADLRILNERHSATDERLLLGGSSHTLKYSHPLPAVTPMLERHNMAWMGTTVVSGEAYGIVIGTGADTELGRIAHQTSIAPEFTTPLERSFRRVARSTIWAALAMICILLVVAWQTGTDEHTFALMVLAVLAAAVPNGLPLVFWLRTKRTALSLHRLGLHIRSTQALERISGLDLVLFDPHTFADRRRTVSQLLIGRTAYTVTGDGYNPAGKVLDAHGKRVLKKDVQALSLIFEASALSHHADVFEPDNQHKAWYAHGDHTEAALLTLARKSGLQTGKLRTSRQLIRSIPFDHHHQLSSMVRQYGADAVLFTYGTPEAILGRSAKLWDHGHIRNLSAGDRTHITHHLVRSAAEGATSVALAYRIIPQHMNAETADTSKLEHKLVLLGIVDMTHAKHDHTLNMLHAARGTRLKVSLLSAEHHPYSVTSHQLERMTDVQLLQRLQRGTATFAGLTSEDKVRLVQVAQSAGQHIAITCSNLGDLPAACQADAVLAATDTSRLVRATATATTNSPELLLSATHLADAAVEGLHRVWQLTATTTLALLCLVLLTATATLSIHIPFAISPLLLIALTLLLEPLSFLTIGSGNTTRQQRERFDHGAALLFGLLIAGLAYGNFLLFFSRSGLNPAYLDPANPLVAHAAALVLATVVLCSRITVVLSQRQHPFTFDTPARRSLFAFAATLTIFVVVIYWLPAQQLFGTRGMDATDWLCGLFAAAIYAGCRVLQRHTRHHSRRAIIDLHHATFGKTSPARV